MRRTYQLLILVGMVLLTAAGLLFTNLLLDIERMPADLDELPDSSASHPDTSKPVVHIGVISRYAPYLIYEGYQPIMDYLTEQSDYTFTLRLSSSYQDAADQLLDGTVAASFFGTQIYLDMAETADIIPILAPLSEGGKPYVHSVLITSDLSPIVDLHDLTGHSLALPSKRSFSGQWGMGYLIDTIGSVSDGLEKVQHFAHHQTVIYKVLRGEYDAGVVKDRVADEFIGKGIRILATSPPFPSAPIVALRGKVDPAVKQMEALLLALDPNALEDSELLSHWDPEFAYGFAKVTPSMYAEAKRQLASKTGEGEE